MMSTSNGVSNGVVHPHPERCILVTGGAGYIGSHTTLQLLLDGYKVVIVDNYVNSCVEAVNRVADLAEDQGKNLVVHEVTSTITTGLPCLPSIDRISSTLHSRSHHIIKSLLDQR